MLTQWRGDAKFYNDLLKFDEKFLELGQQKGCPHCGGRLDRADYPRKPRGLPEEVEEAYALRLSLCCREDGCRRRLTPPSLRFFGRRVYAGAVFLFISALFSDPVESMSSAAKKVEVPKRTVGRWLLWWKEKFRTTLFWRIAGARFLPPIPTSSFAYSLVARFYDTCFSEAMKKTLHFIAPVTTKSSPKMMFA